MEYKHLSIEERETLQELLWQKKSLRHIAEVLNRSVSSISREIRRNGAPGDRRISKRYIPRLANERALTKRKSRGRKLRLKNQRIREYVITHLKKRWSPEQIAGRMKIEIREDISHEAIYQYIYHQIHRNGWGELKPGREDLRIYLRRKQKRRQKKGLRKSERIFKPKGLSIDERPHIVKAKRRYGDWEGDTVESRDHKPGVNTLLERKSGLYLITHVNSKNAESTVKAVVSRFKDIPQKLKKTLTLDNGPENSDWDSLQKEVHLTCYYAHPYCSGERGANENANGLLREYFPKKTDFSTIPVSLLAAVENELNSRPRKRLGWKTPLEVWSVALRG